MRRNPVIKGGIPTGDRMVHDKAVLQIVQIAPFTNSLIFLTFKLKIVHLSQHTIKN